MREKNPRLDGVDSAPAKTRRPVDRNKRAGRGVQSGVILRSRWFPLGLAVLQCVSFVALIAFNYWRESDNAPQLLRYVRGDLSRPFFEPPVCCHGEPTDPQVAAAVSDLCETPVFRSHDGPAIAMHLPAFAVAAVGYGALSHSGVCLEALTNPRGQIFVAPLIPLLWFFVGRSIRRIAQHRWHPPAARLITKGALSLGLILLPLGLLGLLSVLFGVFFNWETALRGLGIAFWSLYIPFLAAERLRIWPFSRERA